MPIYSSCPLRRPQYQQLANTATWYHNHLGGQVPIIVLVAEKYAHMHRLCFWIGFVYRFPISLASCLHFCHILILTRTVYMCNLHSHCVHSSQPSHIPTPHKQQRSACRSSCRRMPAGHGHWAACGGHGPRGVSQDVQA